MFDRYIAKRIDLLDTILMDEKQLKILLGYDYTQRSYTSFYYLLNNISNDEEDKRKLDEILNKARENTDKIKLLQGIVSKATELISNIDKEEKRKKSQKELLLKKTDIEDKKGYILNYINDNKGYIDSKEKLVNNDTQYSILIKEEKTESHRGVHSITIYYLLYKKHDIYTMKTKWLSTTGDRPIISPELLDYKIDFDYSHCLNNLYKTLQSSPSVGGNPIASAASAASATPAYKLNGEKVHLLINKKKLHRSVYVKDKGNGKAKYCKINNEFVLLSKLKNKVI
jgi:hypothetical protein